MVAATALLNLQHVTSNFAPDSQRTTVATSPNSLPAGPAVCTTIEEVEDVDRKLINYRQYYQTLTCHVTDLSYRGRCLPSDSAHLLDLDTETTGASHVVDSKSDHSRDFYCLETWVGCDKLWDDSTIPDSIKSARNAAREVPPWALRACTPTPEVTVAAVLKDFVPPPNTSEST